MPRKRSGCTAIVVLLLTCGAAHAGEDSPALAGPPGPGSTPGAAFDAPPGDGRRTLSALPKNVARGFVGVFSRESLGPLLLGGAASLAGHRYDGRAESWLEGRCTPCGQTGATAGGLAIVPVVGAVFAAGRFAPEGSLLRAASYDAAAALVVNAAWTGALKYTVPRRRPDGSDFLSLPSGHSSTAFALATVAERHYGWKAGVPAYLLAAGIGLSRVESDRHHLSDVLAGATLGIVVGRAVTRVNAERPPSRRRLAVTPATDANGGGVGVGLSASW